MTTETTRKSDDTSNVATPSAQVAPNPTDGSLSPEAGAKDLTPMKRDTSKAPAIYGSFGLGNTEFALHAGVIKEVVNEPATISEIPLSPAFMLGLFNLRGRIIPIVDLRLLLELPDNDATDRKVAIVEDGELCTHPARHSADGLWKLEPRANMATLSYILWEIHQNTEIQAVPAKSPTPTRLRGNL